MQALSFYRKSGERLVAILFCLVLAVIAAIIEKTYHSDCLGGVATIACLIFVGASRRSLMEPSSLFIAAFWLFLVSRHLLADIGLAPTPIITSAPFSDPELFVYRVVLSVTVPAIMLVYEVLSRPSTLVFRMISLHTEKFSRCVNHCRIFALVACLIAGPILIDSVQAMTKAISASGYEIALVDDSVTHFSVTAYTVLKWAWIIAYCAYLHRRRVCWAITGYFLLCLSATLASGLRGYFFLYTLFAVMLVDGSGVFKIRPLFAVVGGALALIAATVLLEYRLGFPVSDATGLAKLSSGLWSQGVTTEVFYGAVEQKDNINFLENVLLQGRFGNQAFGYTLDALRGIYYAGGGGLASSGFAEAYVGGWLVYASTLVLLGNILKLLDLCFINVKESALCVVILFFFFPAIIYFPRGSVNPLIVKSAVLFFAAITTYAVFYSRRAKLGF